MSTKNFAKTVWEARVLDNFHNTAIASVISTPPASMTGSSIVFNRAASGTIGDYTGAITWNDLNTEKIEMTFGFKKYFAFACDDVDKAQTDLDVIDATTREHSAKLAEAADAYVLGIAKSGASSSVGTSASKKQIYTPEEMYDYICDCGAQLGANKAPLTDRYVVVPSAALNLLSKDRRFTLNPEVLANGVVQGAKINGMTVVVSENIPENTVICLHKSALGWGSQLDEVEALRLPDAFADGVRGLMVGGAAVLNPAGVCVLYYSITSNVLTGITVGQAPTTVTYAVGDKLSLAGLVVLANYTNGAVRIVSGYTTDPVEGAVLASDDTAITVSYTEGGVTKTATQAITVS